MLLLETAAIVNVIFWTAVWLILLTRAVVLTLVMRDKFYGIWATNTFYMALSWGILYIAFSQR